MTLVFCPLLLLILVDMQNSVSPPKGCIVFYLLRRHLLFGLSAESEALRRSRPRPIGGSACPAEDVLVARVRTMSLCAVAYWRQVSQDRDVMSLGVNFSSDPENGWCYFWFPFKTHKHRYQSGVPSQQKDTPNGNPGQREFVQEMPLGSLVPWQTKPNLEIEHGTGSMSHATSFRRFLDSKPWLFQTGVHRSLGFLTRPF